MVNIGELVKWPCIRPSLQLLKHGLVATNPLPEANRNDLPTWPEHSGTSQGLIQEKPQRNSVLSRERKNKNGKSVRESHPSDPSTSKSVIESCVFLSYSYEIHYLMFIKGIKNE